MSRRGTINFNFNLARMKNILITRQKKRSQKMLQLLEDQGFEVFAEPLFSVKKILPKKAFLKQPSALIITSSNACGALEKSGISKDVKIFCVGKTTAEKLAALGFEKVVFPKKENALFLKDLIVETYKTKSEPLLYFQGAITSFDFKKELKKFGFEVENILSYETKEKQNFSLKLQNFCKKNNFDQILIFSQNSLRIFLKLAAKHNMLEYFKASQILCLSEKILLEVKKLGFQNSATFNQLPILKNFYERESER
jgi:uroporphyrinogen-III synthase